MPSPCRRFRTGAGAFANTLLAGMTQAGVASDAAILAAMRQSLAAFGVTSLPPDLGATGFSAVDAQGQAVSCAVTLNGPFGSGRIAGATGVVLGASPAALAGISTAFLTPVLGQRQPAWASRSRRHRHRRAQRLGGCTVRAFETGRRSAAESRPTDLRATGAEPFATVNVISCQGGYCVPLPDPGANGLGAAAEPASDTIKGRRVMKIEGRCHCGAIEYEAEVDAATVSICHCGDCQTLSGAPFRANVPARAANFKLTRGTPLALRQDGGKR